MGEEKKGRLVWVWQLAGDGVTHWNAYGSGRPRAILCDSPENAAKNASTVLPDDGYIRVRVLDPHTGETWVFGVERRLVVVASAVPNA